LHHLDIEKASCEIYRVLKKEGRALFLEPLGHNPFIRLYRKMTPHKRTPDEHPLLISHIRSLAAPFSKVECKYFYFLSVSANLILMLTKSTFLFRKTYNALERADEIFLNLFPFLRRYCWSVIIVLEK
jgi:ubiquinone/menaquinone biosynthesis C-methylase UbiE